MAPGAIPPAALPFGRVEKELERQKPSTVDLLTGEPADVEAVARAVGKLFERDAFATKKELEEMKKLAADASLHFPAEFQLAQENPQAVRMSFKRAAAASAAMGV